jgi:hypothetical protein
MIVRKIQKFYNSSIRSSCLHQADLTVRKQQSLNCSNPTAWMERKMSSPHSQHPTTSPWPSPHPHTLHFMIRFIIIIILHRRLVLPSGLFLRCLQTDFVRSCRRNIKMEKSWKMLRESKWRRKRTEERKQYLNRRDRKNIRFIYFYIPRQLSRYND